MKKKGLIITITLLILTIVIVGGLSYAYFIATINNDNAGEVDIKAKTLGLHFTDGPKINLVGILPGQTIIKKFSVTNTGTETSGYNIYINDLINEITNTDELVFELTSTNDGATITETVFPTASGAIASNISIDPNVTQEYTMTIRYLNTNSSQNIDMDKLISGLIQITEFEKIAICKRATTLHTETCNQTSNFCAGDGYTQGSTITYGNLGTSGTLATGDAFDCDVNGDGTHDPSTERFYYVTDMDSDTAVMIYYNNVSMGIPDNTSSFSYSSSSANDGPQRARYYLPTTAQWSNISLTNSIRNIKDENGSLKMSKFSYSNCAARLLTTQELERGCGFTIGYGRTGEVSTKCQFIMENTKYSNSSLIITGIWLENPFSYDSNSAWFINSYNRIATYLAASQSASNGVRPTIEVPKTDIEI